MIDPLGSFESQSDRLRKITGLVPIQILSPQIHPDEHGCLITVVPLGSSDGRAPTGNIVGIRLFHGPREVIIDKICLDGADVLQGPFDAAAYAIETPMLPLESCVDPGYRGEALRFVAVRWGVFSIVRPLHIYVRAWGMPSALPQLFGYLVAELERFPNDRVTEDS